MHYFKELVPSTSKWKKNNSGKFPPHPPPHPLLLALFFYCTEESNNMHVNPTAPCPPSAAAHVFIKSCGLAYALIRFLITENYHSATKSISTSSKR